LRISVNEITAVKRPEILAPGRAAAGTDGYGADIQKVRKTHPGLLDLETWIKEESDFVSK